mgnify:FL=1
MNDSIIIFGAGGFAREVAWLIRDINQQRPNNEKFQIAGFVEHSSSRIGERLNGIPIITLNDAKKIPHAKAIVAIGSPEIKARAVREAEDAGLDFATLVHPTVLFDEDTVSIGTGSVICAGTILTVNITLGCHVIINLDCTVGHDCVLEDFVTISPGCHLSGYTNVHRSAYLGTGSVTVEGHHIGAEAVIGAGAVVVKDIPAGVTAVGVRAKAKNR